jgi:rod shape-determining protein MreC
MLKRSHYIALGIVVVLTLTVMNLPSRTKARVKQGIASLFAPPFGLTRSAKATASKAGDYIVPRSELIKQNEALRLENEQLKLLLQEAEKIGKENAQLHKLLGFQQRTQLKLRPANIVLHDPANWWRSVKIDLGTRDGLSNNLPVLTIDGFLAGRISSVSLTSSQVVLLGDPNCKVHARVEDTGDTGVVGASGPLDSEFVEMNYLSKNANLKPGQNVKTSGEGGIFPRDIPIGKIMDTHSVEYGLATVARVKLGANLNALEQVWVRFK